MYVNLSKKYEKKLHLHPTSNCHVLTCDNSGYILHSCKTIINVTQR